MVIVAVMVTKDITCTLAKDNNPGYFQPLKPHAQWEQATLMHVTPYTNTVQDKQIPLLHACVVNAYLCVLPVAEWATSDLRCERPGWVCEAEYSGGRNSSKRRGLRVCLLSDRSITHYEQTPFHLPCSSKKKKTKTHIQTHKEDSCRPTQKVRGLGDQKRIRPNDIQHPITLHRPIKWHSG